MNNTDVKKSLIIIPTYNEAGNIERLIRAIRVQAPSASILVVDDNSPDGCADVVEKLRKNDSRIDIIKRPGKLGIGTAYIEGFRYAIEKGFDIVFQMDADFSHDPVHLPQFFSAIKEADLVLGCRYMPGGGVENWPVYRQIVSLGGSLYSRIILSLPYKDLTGGFKCFRTEVLKTISLDDVGSEGYSFQIEMTYKAHKLGFKIVETPITFKERKVGVSKMSWKILFEAVVRVWFFRFFA